jgi:hypothetical protein
MSDTPNDPVSSVIEETISSAASSISTSLIRTVVPLIVGWIVAVLLKIHVSADASQVALWVSPLVTAMYYSGVRLLEEKVNPAFGWLLGKASAPQY